MGTEKKKRSRWSSGREFLRQVARRRVLPVGAAYFVGAWVLIEVGSVVLPAFAAPDWVLRALIIAAVAGFPVALVLAWVFDLTPRGVVRTDDADKPAPDTDTPPDAAPAPAAPPTSERRHLTVLSGGIEWSGGDADGDDPELLRAILPEVQQICAAIVAPHGGSLAGPVSDEFIIYFGYPVATGDDARRAVSCGLQIVEGVRRLSARLHAEGTVDFSARIGIATGLAIVETTGNREDDVRVLGKVLRNAGRLRASGAPGELLIGPATYALVHGYFYEQPVGKTGAEDEPTAYRVLHESGARNRIEARGALLPLTGRDHELALLEQRWELALEGHGQIVLINGEPGIGKSRLVHAIREHVASDARAWLTDVLCSPDHSEQPLYPVRVMLERRIREALPPGQQEIGLRHVEGLVAQFGVATEVAVPLMANLLGVALDERYAPLQMSAARQKEKTLELLLIMLERRGRQQPLLLVVEDLHWADPTFLELLRMIVQQGSTGQTLTVFTARPDMELEWARRTHVTSINLVPLTARATQALVDSAAGGRELPTGIGARIALTSQGNPLFAEELTRHILASHAPDGDETGADIEIPGTLQESLLARLDQLGPARAVARLAATVGREFGYPLTDRFARELGVGDLDDQLRTLVDADIIYQRGMPPDAEYTFKHVLLRETAYQSLLKTEREDYHKRIAALLEQEFAADCEARPEVLAHHLTAGGLVAKGIPLWLEAGRRALRKSALLEAQAILRRALRLLETLPETTERNALELELQITLGPALMARRGYSAPEVAAVYQRAEQLCAASGNSPRIAPVLFGLWAYHVVHGALPRALELGEQLLAIARSVDNEDLLLESHVLLGVTKTHTADVTEALAHLRAAAGIYTREKHAQHAYVYGQDPQMASLIYSASCQWWLGLADQASASIDAGVAFARELNHPHSLAFALAIGARCHHKRGDYAACIELASEAVDLAHEYGFAVWEPLARFLRASARYRLHADATIMTDIRTHLADCLRSGNALSTIYYHSVVADDLSAAGQIDEACAYLDAADSELPRLGRNSDETELLRVRGMVLWRQASRGLAEMDDVGHWLRRALDSACEMGAVSWRLRAAVSLAEFLRECDQDTEATQVLHDALEELSEGADLPTQRRAHELIGASDERHPADSPG